MKIKKSLWLCIRECSIEISKDGAHSYYSAGEIIEDSQKPNESCFLHITTQQARELSKILKCIQKEKAYQEKQRLAIHNAHPRVNWKATQRLNGSIQEARSMRKRFNNIVSEIAGKDIEVFWDCKTENVIRW
jgi:hypothetical protein